MSIRLPFTAPVIHLGFVLGLVALGCSERAECGPENGMVSRVIDGDTIELAGGERVRYLLVDTPETTNGHDDCFGVDARDFNRSLVEGRQVSLRYAEQCRDRYERLLAYVSVDGREINSLLVREGFGCVLHISPDGDDRFAEFQSLEREAQRAERGLWGACAMKPCG